MKKDFTKKDLHTGDIVETRDHERGVVILDNDCILWQKGGLDILDDSYTDDLFVDAKDRSGDIFKVFHDPEGPIGFNKLFGIEPVFVRRNDAKTKACAQELSDKHDTSKDRDTVTVVLLEPWSRKYENIPVNVFAGLELDLLLSQAPSMIACGEWKTDRTYIAVPHTDNLFVIYNKYQEEWHLQNVEMHKKDGFTVDEEPLVVIPEENIAIYSRCMIVKKNDAGEFADLLEDDFEKVKEYMIRMEKKIDKNDKIHNVIHHSRPYRDQN